ncbi:MAG: cation:proton antiporter [Hespellia sp.]|nr:cation:proton antiporter [Hespellia sp.]
MSINILRWIAVLVIAFLAGKLMTKIKMPSILGWLIAGMILGPHAVNLIPQSVLDAGWYKTIIMWMQCAFGIMLGSELIWSKLKSSGKALIITTLTQSLGTFAVVSLAFGIVFYFTNVPIFLTFIFGSIALATAPAPALSVMK